MELVLRKDINSVLVDGYAENNEAWFTRTQIGELLEYKNPNREISHIHNKHKERLDAFSVVVKLRTTDGKAYDTYVYNTKGVFEICRWSRQPKADMVMDALFDMAEEVREKGYYSVLPDTELVKLIVSNMNDEDKLESVIIPALREGKINQSMLMAKYMGLTAEEFRKQPGMIRKANANEDARKRLERWREKGVRVYTIADFPEEQRNRFYMESMIKSTAQKPANSENFADYCGDVSFNKHGYLAVINALIRNRWIDKQKGTQWAQDEGLV